MRGAAPAERSGPAAEPAFAPAARSGAPWAIGIGVGALPLAVLLVPRPATGDLHSHVYNAWLARLAARGEVPGVVVVGTWTNVLVDHLLERLLAIFSVPVAETLAMLLLAEAFLWSSFVFCRALTRRSCWEWLPVLGSLALGWTFQMGFANWYASAALSLLAAAVALGSSRWRVRVGVAMPLILLAATASPLPVVWSVVAVALVLVIRRWPGRAAPATLAAVAVTCAPAAALLLSGRARYHVWQLSTASGADQLHVFGDHYRWFAIALLAIWAATLEASRSQPARASALAVAVFSTATCLLVPDVMRFPGFAAPFSFHAARTSLLSGIAWTALGACAPPVRWRSAVIGLLVVGWSALVVTDVRAISRAHQDIERAIATLPPGSRIVSAIRTAPSRVQVLEHVVDAACVGRCFSWGNYEPASTQFRVRARGDNAFVVSAYSDAMHLVAGTYRAPDLPFPLWKLHPCGQSGDPRICASSVAAGEAIRLECVDPFSRLGGLRPDGCR
jgi:hypothetical protein